jgi:hypothetical protein
VLFRLGPVHCSPIIASISRTRRRSIKFHQFIVCGNSQLLGDGADFRDAFVQTGRYAGRILKGAKPADLPVMQPSKLELVINLKTAKALGFTISPSLLAVCTENPIPIPVIVGNSIRLASEVEIGRCSWLMRDVCSLICLALIGLFRSRASLQAEILTLRHQPNVLRRKSPERLTFTSIDRLVFAGCIG